MVKRWINRNEKEGLKGLEEKRGKSRGKGRQRKNPSLNEELVRLRAENEYLKKLLALRRGVKTKKSKSQEYTIIESLANDYSVGLLFKIAGVSRSGYYKWHKT
jgi:transposase